MSYLAIPLGLAAGGILTYIGVTLRRADQPALTAPMPSPAGSITPATGRARVADQSLVITPPPAGRHRRGSVDVVDPTTYDPPLYSPGFASVMGYDRPAARPGRGSDR